jgi:hypothetical protein
MHYFGNISTEDLRKFLSRSQLDVVFLDSMKKKYEKTGDKEAMSCYFVQHKKELEYCVALGDEIAKRELLNEH